MELSLEVVNRWNNQALSMLYQHFYQAMTHLAYCIVGDEEAARDCVQEVFSTLWQKRPQLSSIPLFKAYLYNSVRNISIDYLRRQHLPTSRIDTMEQQHKAFVLSETGEETMFEEEIYRQLFQAIDALPAQQRQIFLLAMEGRKMQEIASQLEISINTVKTQKQRGMKTLRAQLKESAALSLVIALGL